MRKGSAGKSEVQVVTSLDLEMNQPSGKIIQIGAVAGDVRTGQVLSSLRLYVNPGEPVSQYIQDLCGISQRDIDDKGMTLLEAYRHLRDFHRQSESFINPVTWGGGDSAEIREQLGTELDPEDWCFGRRWIDVKTIHTALRVAKDKSVQGGLARCMTKYGLAFQGRKHDAQDDALNTFRLYCRLLEILGSGNSSVTS